MPNMVLKFVSPISIDLPGLKYEAFNLSGPALIERYSFMPLIDNFTILQALN